MIQTQTKSQIGVIKNTAYKYQLKSDCRASIAGESTPFHIKQNSTW